MLALDFCKEKDLKIKLEITLECDYSKAGHVINLLPADSKWKKKPIKKQISDYFKSKEVDSAEFPGGKYTQGDDKFYIEQEVCVNDFKVSDVVEVTVGFVMIGAFIACLIAKEFGVALIGSILFIGINAIISAIEGKNK